MLKWAHMKKFLHRFIERIENAPLSLGSFMTTFLALILVRLTIEDALSSFGEQPFFYNYFEFTHTFLFFLCSLILLLPVINYAGANSLKKAVNMLLFGFLIILTPPIIDKIIFRGEYFWSFYEFDSLHGLFIRFFTLFGDTPDVGITYGVRVEVVFVTIALGIYAYLKSGQFRKASLVMLLTYTILFVLGTFPSWVTFPVMIVQKNLLAINANDTAALFLAPGKVLGRSLTDFRGVLNFKMSLVYVLLASFLSFLLIIRQYPKYFWALLKNTRFPQLVYHAGLLFLGISLAFYFSDTPFTLTFFSVLGIIVLLIAVECAWIASVIANDCYDTAIDAITNPNRPLITNAIPQETYRVFGVIFFIASLIFSGIVSFSAMLILLSYQALAWLYSASPLRLKKYPGIATLMASAAGMLVLIAGFVTIAHTIHSLPLPLLSYLFLAYFLALPVKDFKDIAGDKRDHIYTIPVLLGANLGKQVIGSLLFLLFAYSPLVLHIRSLIFSAIFFGGLAFFTLQKGTPNEHSFFAFRKLPGLILTITILYGIAIILFLR